MAWLENHQVVATRRYGPSPFFRGRAAPLSRSCADALQKRRFDLEEESRAFLRSKMATARTMAGAGATAGMRGGIGMDSNMSDGAGKRMVALALSCTQ
jgi:hypothetical protein